MNRLAEILTDFVIQKGTVKEDERELYKYGFTIALETLLSLIISLCIAAVLHMAAEGILFFIVFIPLRSYAGGLHLDCYWACLALSSFVFVVVLLTAKTVIFPGAVIFIVFIALECIVSRLYPVNHRNRTVEEEEENYFRKRLFKFLATDFLIALLFFLFGRIQYLMVITATFLMVVITMAIGKFRNIKEIKEKKMQ